MERYEVIEPKSNEDALGIGSYGEVFRAWDKKKMIPVAMKKIRVSAECDGLSPTTVREITLLTQLRHENIVKLDNVIMDRSRNILIFELVDMDLKKYIDSNPDPLPEQIVKVISYTFFVV